MEAKYAIAKYPELLDVDILVGNYYIQKANFQLFNQEDKIDYSLTNKIPIELVKGLEIEKEELDNGLYIKDNILIKAKESKRKLIIPNNVVIINEKAFVNSKIINIQLPNSVSIIGNKAFYNCNSLTTITIPNSVTSIGNYAFGDCSKLVNVTFERNSKISRIKDSTFSECSSLISIKLPNSIKSIGAFNFTYSDNLKDIYYEGTEVEWDKITIEYGNDPLLNATIHYNTNENYKR